MPIFLALQHFWMSVSGTSLVYILGLRDVLRYFEIDDLAKKGNRPNHGECKLLPLAKYPYV